MGELIELVQVVIGLTIVLSLVLSFVFIAKKLRGASTREAAQFVTVGLAICAIVSVTFVVGVTAIGAVVDVEELEAEQNCDRLDGELHVSVGSNGERRTMCVVGG